MGLSWPSISKRFRLDRTPFTQNTNKKEMGKLREDEKEWPTLCLKIQDPADVAQGIRILRGEESLGKIRCIQLYVVFLF